MKRPGVAIYFLETTADRDITNGRGGVPAREAGRRLPWSLCRVLSPGAGDPSTTIA